MQKSLKDGQWQKNEGSKPDYKEGRAGESASTPLVGFGVLNDNLIKCLISFVEMHEQILSNRYKSIHGYITRSTIMMQMKLCDQCV
jgi:hypothetical protein